MKIKKFSELTDVPIFTLHYYEKIGLLRNIKRDKSGHREFTDDELTWINFIKWLKDTDMSLENIQQYADLREKGDSTAKQRMNILEKHAAIVKMKIAEQTQNLHKLEDKIKYYENILQNNALT